MEKKIDKNNRKTIQIPKDKFDTLTEYANDNGLRLSLWLIRLAEENIKKGTSNLKKHL
jgi:hypothetical protein